MSGYFATVRDSYAQSLQDVKAKKQQIEDVKAAIEEQEKKLAELEARLDVQRKSLAVWKQELVELERIKLADEFDYYGELFSKD